MRAAGPRTTDQQARDPGSDGDCFRVLKLSAARRVTIPDLRALPRRRRGGSSGRYALRARKLTPTEASIIRALAGSKSLRSLAADFSVSHEIVRSIFHCDK